MGTSFFKQNAKQNSVTPKSFNLEARALGAPAYAGGKAALGAQKALGTAMLKPNPKKLTGTSAYPKGPKV
jgi:hypothetical protein